MKLCGVVCLAISPVVFGQTYTISTFAGGGPADNAPATSIALEFTQGVASDAAGNLFITTIDSVSRMDAATGTARKILGIGATGVAVDSVGNVYVAIFQGTRIQKISNGIVTDVAGGGTIGVLGDNGPALGAWLRSVSGLAVDAAGSLYIADSGTQRIRKVSNGIITTLAGNAVCVPAPFVLISCTGGFSGDDGPATSAQLSSPRGVAVDAAGNVYVADLGNGRIRRISNGVITTVPAVGTGPLAPYAIAVNFSGDLYAGDDGQRPVQRISNGIATTVAGTGARGLSGDNGPAVSAQLSDAIGVAVDGAGRLYIADQFRIRRVSNGIITTVVGNGQRTFSGDGGPATGAQLFNPQGVAVDTAGNLYFGDTGNGRVRKVSSGVIATVAGGGTGVDNGPAIGAQLSSPGSVAVDSAGNLYFQESSRIRKVSNGVITTVAGNGVAGFSDDGIPATDAAINPQSIAVDPAGTLYFAESGTVHGSSRNRVRKVSNGLITTVAGTGTAGFTGDGGPATSAELNSPYGIALDSAGDLYIGDLGNFRVRKVSNGVITTVVGSGQCCYGGDGGPATGAQGQFAVIAVDAEANLYLSSISGQIRKVSSGVITAIGGDGTTGLSGDNGPALDAKLSNIAGLAVDSAGNVYIADSGNNRIRVLTPGPPVPGPDLTITKFHAGNFTQGQFGAIHTITVGNVGTEPSNGIVIVTNTALPGLTATAMTGSGWTCTQPAGPCTRADSLSPGLYYPGITLKMNVAQDVFTGSNMTAKATVSGGGDINARNNTALDSTMVDPAGPLSFLGKNSASHADDALAPDMIAMTEMWGIAQGLITAPAGAWPTSLGGVSLEITDSQGVKRLAPIGNVSTSSMSYLIPAETALGPATVKLTTWTGAIVSGLMQINRLSPGLYSANASGSGVAAGVWIRTSPDGADTTGYLFDPLLPVGSRYGIGFDPGPASDRVFLSLHGTGFRSANQVTATVGGVSVAVSSFGSSGGLEGEDVVNVGPLPGSMVGGDIPIVLTFDGQQANTVTFSIRAARGRPTERPPSGGGGRR